MMDNSFIQSQHPVVEELLTNKYFGDTLLVCANGHLTDNKLAVGLLFPSLLSSDIFALPIENVLLVPDYTMEEIGREFEKLILGGSPSTPSQNHNRELPSTPSLNPPRESNSTPSLNPTRELNSTPFHNLPVGLKTTPSLNSSQALSSTPSVSTPLVHIGGFDPAPLNNVEYVNLVSSNTAVLNPPLENTPVSFGGLRSPSMGHNTSVVGVHYTHTPALDHPQDPLHHRQDTLHHPQDPLHLGHPGDNTRTCIVSSDVYQAGGIVGAIGTGGVFGTVDAGTGGVFAAGEAPPSTFGTYILDTTDYAATEHQDEDCDDVKNDDDNLIIDMDHQDLQQVSVPNGYSEEDCENLSISAQTDNSIQIFIENTHSDHPTDADEPTELIYEEHTFHLESDTLVQKVKKSVTFKEPVPVAKKRRLRRSKLKIEEYEDEDVDMIENLNDKGEDQSEDSKQESPILEERKPGRPRTKPSSVNKPENSGLTTFRINSAQAVGQETFKCVECGKALSCRGSLNRHLLVHSDGKPFKCNYCPKSFREAAKRSTHERCHTGSKPYQCRLCTKSFRTATQRQVHQLSHTKEKPYQCAHCGQTFAQKYTMKGHIKRFH